MSLISPSIKKVLRYGLRYSKYQIIMLLLFIPPLVFMIVRPFFIRYLVDDIVSNGKGSILIPFLLLFVFTIILERLASYFCNVYAIKVTSKVVTKQQVEIYNHLQKHSITYFTQHSTGEITTKLLSDIQMIVPTMVMSLPKIIFNILALIAYMIVLLSFSWQLTLIVICSLPLYYLSQKLCTQKLRNAAQSEREAFGKLNESAREKVEGMWVIKGFNKYNYFHNIFGKDSKNWSSKLALLYTNRITIENVTYFITSITPVLILGVGGMNVIKGLITLGTLVGFFSYISWVYEPIDKINQSIIEFQSIDPVARRFFGILEAEKENQGGRSTFPSEYSISFENIFFSYNDTPILKGVNFEIQKNETLAIVGLSGSGKSTIANLLCNYFKPQNGVIKVHHLDIKELSLQEIRQNILIVRQGDYLFNLSVKENILLDDIFSDHELEESIKLAGAEEFIKTLPEYYETLVGERGASLSDGQRQRICLARALIRNPKILILDEATSALDTNVEERIFEGLKQKIQTVILISHRLSTIVKADRILVLDNGQIVGIGTHEELLLNCSEYKNIIAKQLQDNVA